MIQSSDESFLPGIFGRFRPSVVARIGYKIYLSRRDQRGMGEDAIDVSHLAGLPNPARAGATDKKFDSDPAGQTNRGDRNFFLPPLRPHFMDGWIWLRNHPKLHPPVFGATLLALVVSNGFLASISLDTHSVTRNVEFIHKILLSAFRSLL
jgi:hypothetical protein